MGVSITRNNIEYPVNPNRIGLSMPQAKLKALILAHVHRHGHPPLQCQNTGRFQPFKTQKPLIIDDRPNRFEKALFRFIALIGFNDFGNRPNGQLGRQTKPFPHIVITGFLQNKLGRALFPKRHFGKEHRCQIS